MDYSVFNAIAAGFGKVVFVIRKAFETEFNQQVLSKYQKLIPCEVVFQEIDKLPSPFTVPPERERPWGTNHAVMMAADVISEPFCVINADDYYGKEAFSLMAQALSSLSADSRGEYFMVSYPLGKTLSEGGAVSRGICRIDSNKKLIDIEEHCQLVKNDEGTVTDCDTNRKYDSSTPVSMNFWGFTPDYFMHSEKLFRRFLSEHGQEQKGEFYIPSAVASLLEDKLAEVTVMSSHEEWFGVTYPEDRPLVVNKLKQMHAEGVYPSPLFPNS